LRIATFVHNGKRHVGQVSADGLHVTPFALSESQAHRGAQPIIEALVAAQPLPAMAGAALDVSSVQLESPLPVPRRNVWCVGRNYHAHAKELQASVFKDSKAELAVIIGQGGKNISQADAMKHVFGYTVVNDVTARDVQMRHQQWDMGKSFDTFCPMGPWIVTADEVDGRNTRVRCWVNGELRQDGPTENMIFDIPTLIETISRGITLYPGDIIATGTPAGVGMGLNPPRYIAKGDVIRVEIDGVGQIENRFV
jgi:2-keto-4-pentenoate hydratase/2-oxohepta-3-ene-1,7-dioic acid hydratase in catechol pathway